MISRDTLHFLTCGHVDDGKSTLIGRLLYDVSAIPDDQAAGATVDGALDYSRLLDGLEDERSQGITIDAAYRYFRYGGRHFRIADTPGHVQYVRNMAVAAANSDVALILVDAAHGVREQTIRHSKIAAFFGIRQFVIVANKMDLVGYSETKFKGIEKDYRDQMADVPNLTLTFIPVSAIAGDNVFKKTTNMPWYKGEAMMDYLQKVQVQTSSMQGVRLPVQSVIRFEDRRGYQGMLNGGVVKEGDRLQVDGTGSSIGISRIYHSGKQVKEASAGQAVTLVTDDDVDIARGNVLYPASAPITSTESFVGSVLWLDPSFAGRGDIQCTLKIHNREEQVEVRQGAVNGPIVDACIFAALPIPVDMYAHNRMTGIFMLIELETERAIGVGTVRSLKECDWDKGGDAPALKNSASFF